VKLLYVDKFGEAREKLLDAALALPLEHEELPFEEALGRILAVDVAAPGPVPSFDKSTVDGYAVRASDTAGAGENLPAFLELIGEVVMGQEATGRLEPGQCMAVATGGMVPAGADSVVMTEYAEPFPPSQIAVYDAVSPGRNLIRAGEDVDEGTVLLTRGTFLRPQEIGLLASMGVTNVSVYRPWRVSVLSTGDELVPAWTAPKPGQIRDSNSYSLCAQCARTGFDLVRWGVLADDEEILRTAVREAMGDSDLVLVSGGSSQGKKDCTAKVLDECGSPGVFTHGIAIKPGKPTILGLDRDSRTLLLGLPGHPVAAMLIYELFVDWIWKQRTGVRTGAPLGAVLTTNLPGGEGRTLCQLVRLASGDGRTLAEPVFGNSGLLASLVQADGYLLLEENREGLPAGSAVDVHRI
jgi:molybdopterin molybdotransferase